MVDSIPPQNSESFFSTWSNIEWIVGAIWVAGTFVTGFLWRLSMRVNALELMLVESAADRGKLHGEIHDLNEKLGEMASRADALRIEGKIDALLLRRFEKPL